MNNMIPEAPPIQVQQAVKDAPYMTCECGSKTFTQLCAYKKVPGLYFGETEPRILPVMVIACSKCGKIPDDFMAGLGSNFVEDESKTEEKKDKCSLILN